MRDKVQNNTIAGIGDIVKANKTIKQQVQEIKYRKTKQYKNRYRRYSTGRQNI